jgi:quercetin dioxygenase-like cupin family protein
MAEDSIKADPKHYQIDFENEQVRVLRIRYGPHERSVMHGHPNGVTVFLTDLHVRFTLPDGRTENLDAKAGQVQWLAAGDHLPENLSDQPMELILVELKR